MKYLYFFLLLFNFNLLSAKAKPAVVYQYMAKIKYHISANELVVENQYTHKIERVVIIATRTAKNYCIDQEAKKFIASRYIDAPTPYMVITSYGHEKYGRVLGDIVGNDRCSRLSYDLIAHGYVYWYPGFDPTDETAKQLSYWAKQHNNGLYRR